MRKLQPNRGRWASQISSKEWIGKFKRSFRTRILWTSYYMNHIANPCAYLISSVSFDLFFFYFPLEEVKDVLILGRGHSNKAKTRHPIAHNIKFNLHQIEANVVNKLWGAKRIT